jgi:hypothetical protein
MTAAKPLVRYGAVWACCASGFAKTSYTTHWDAPHDPAAFVSFLKSLELAEQ